jgi:phosphoribosylformylglycinamidine cyclo-ligase
MTTGLTYHSSGVNYDLLDAFKRACQREAAATAGSLAAHDLKEPPAVRGESAYLLETPTEYLAHVEEGLGTKNLVADAVQKLTGRSHYHAIGIDTVATIVNDLITCGALPISIAMHAAVGDARWFEDQDRSSDLASGFADGCRQAGAVWGGGETPALRGLVEPHAIVLAGSAFGRISPKEHRIRGDISAGDAIVLLASSGVQTNGLTLCRAVADRLPQGYATPMADGRMFGEGLLDPSVIYVRFVAACQRAGLRLKYAAHITGHGWRKLMRIDEPFIYRMTDLGQPQPVFPFLMKHAGLDDREAYGTFNMGAGFAAYIAAEDAPGCIELAEHEGYHAWLGGHIEKDGDRKAVILEPLGIAFEGESLQVR